MSAAIPTKDEYVDYARDNYGRCAVEADGKWRCTCRAIGWIGRACPNWIPASESDDHGGLVTP